MSQTTSAGENLQVNPYKGNGFTVETKFMKQYRVASPVDHGIQGAAVRNKDGQIELFTVGTDQTVWNFYPDPTSDTGYRRANTGLKGDFVAAGLDSGGSIVVLARCGAGINYTVKYLANGTWRWSPIIKATLPLLPYSSAVHIRAIYARTVDTQLYVGVDGWVTRTNPSTEVYAAVSQWNVTAGSFQAWYPGDGAWPEMNSGMTSFWTRSAASTTPAFSALFNQALNPSAFCTLDLSGKNIETVLETRTQRLLPNGRSATVDIESTADSFGRNKIFFVGENGNLYQLIPAKKETWALIYNIEPLSSNVHLTKVHAVHDHKGGTHLFCVSADKAMYHLPPNPTFPTGYPPLGPPLKRDVQWVALARNDAGNVELFYAKGTPSAPLIHMTLDQDTGDWEEQTIEVQGSGSPTEPASAGASDSGKIEEFISYSTDLAFTDPAGALLVNAAVTVSSSDRTAITVDGATYSVDASTSATLKTNGTGQLTITQQTSGLSVPDLWIHVDKLMPAHEVLVLEQYANGRDDAGLPKELQSIETRLKTVTGPDLAQAKDASGKLLLKTAIREDPTSCASLASAFKGCMDLRSKQPDSAPATLHPLISREGAWTGMHVESRAAALDRCRVIPHAGLPSWSLSFDNGVHYQALAPEEAKAMMAGMRANASPASSADGTSWWSTIGDFLEAIVEGFVNTVVKITRIVVDGVTAAFDFVMNGVKYVFNAVVQFVQDSFDLIESILATVYETVAKFAEKTFEWIGFLLNWGDILLARDALAYTIDQTLQFAALTLADLRRTVDGAFASAIADIDRAFDDLKNKVQGGTLAGYGSSNVKPNPVFRHSIGNNFVMNGVMNNSSGAIQAKTVSEPIDIASVNNFLAELERFSSDTAGKPEFANTRKNMNSLGSSVDNMFTQALAQLIDLVHSLVRAVVSGVQRLIDIALDALAALVTSIRAFLNAEWEIPFLTPFYRFITTNSEHTHGSPLTILGLLSLLVAIPATTLFKLSQHKAPFPGAKSVESFKSSFNSNGILHNYLPAGEPGTGLAMPDAFDIQGWKVFLGFATAASTMSFWALSAYCDVKPPLVKFPGDVLLAKLILASEVAASAFSCPWLYPPFGPANFSSPDAAARVVWLVELIIGTIMIDATTVVCGHSLPENWNDAGVIISVVYTAFTGIFRGIACAGADHVANLILPLIPNLIKLGRLTAVVTETLGISLFVVAVADGVIGAFIAITSLPFPSQTALTATEPG